MAQIDDRLLDVNQYGVLRIPAGVWLALIFMARHWLMVLVVTVSARRNRDAVQLYGDDFSWWMLALELPALFLLWLCTRRQPDAGRFVRAVWPHARLIAALTAALHIGYVVWFLWNSSYWLPWPELYLASCALIDVAIIYGFYTSDHLRQVFSEFPASPATAPQTASANASSSHPSRPT